VPVDRVVIWAFTLAGLSAGLAGSLNAARTLTAQASDDFGLVFTVIAAVVVGGTSIAGGSGAIWRTVVGVFFIALLGNGFNLNGIDPIVQRIVQGLVILAAVGADAWSRSQRE
jgi:ribose transport system permease protein